MQAIVVTSAGEVAVQQVPIPELAEGQILVKVSSFTFITAFRCTCADSFRLQNCAIALNPTDWKVSSFRSIPFDPLQ
jgi:hypothetical protein